MYCRKTCAPLRTCGIDSWMYISNHSELDKKQLMLMRSAYDCVAIVSWVNDRSAASSQMCSNPPQHISATRLRLIWQASLSASISSSAQSSVGWQGHAVHQLLMWSRREAKSHNTSMYPQNRSSMNASVARRRCADFSPSFSSASMSWLASDTEGF